MNPWIDNLRTPQKRNELILKPSLEKGAFDSHAVDCPFVYMHDDRYYMLFIGFDGVGYRTGLAYSDDLISWEKQGLLIDRGEKGSVTEYNIAFTQIIRENELFGLGQLKPIHNRYVGTYHAYPEPGYEAGAACIGIGYSNDLSSWELAEPVLFAEQGMEWEQGGLYKSWIVEHQGTFYMFYNAKTTEQQWHEQIGLASSTDLIHWERYAHNPIIQNGEKGAFDERFCSDPAVYWCEDHWVMVYFGLAADGHARNGVAISNDLLHWEKQNVLLIDVGAPGTIDSQHAHKACLFYKDKRLYHFYCAVSRETRPYIRGEGSWDELRGITYAYQTE